MKIGIMGGTFDPIHNGHLMLGEYAYREFKLDQVWFMPNGNPPHKQDNVFQTTREDRMEMVTRSIEKYDYFRLEDYEIKRQEISYSYQTMEYFKTQTIRLPFVVDSPRGKEASQESSKEILSMIAGISMLPQVILATIDFNDYKDSLGDSAKNATVITLQKHNRLLDEADYITHEAEIEQLLNLFNVCKE